MKTAQETARVRAAAASIVDNVIDLQVAMSGQTSPQAMRLMRNIQQQAGSLISGSDLAASAPMGMLGQGYRLDTLEVIQGLAEVLCCEQGRVKGVLSDEDLHLIAMAAEVAYNRINNYLLVKRVENAMLARAAKAEARPVLERESQEG